LESPKLAPPRPSETATSKSDRFITTPRGRRHPLPLFLPVCQLNAPFVPMEVLREVYRVDGGILNSYFLYKQRELRDQFDAGLTLREYAGLGEGLLVTDSGAFQGFVRKLFLSNKTIVAFQEQIGTDVSSPLDLVTPPGDKRGVAEDKLVATNKRIREALPLVEQSMLAGVQQGGRFLDLRRRSTDELCSATPERRLARMCRCTFTARAIPSRYRFSLHWERISSIRRRSAITPANERT
jgi:7-cyano-7-deazaguanine tRNA-ribosyltransferase